MKNYICEPCNFISNKKTNYEIHLHTKTHIDNITPDDKFCCNLCLKIFSHKSNLYRHYKTCEKTKKNNITNDDINDDNNDNIDINNDVLIENLLLKQKVKFLQEKALLESKLIKSELESKLTSKLIRAEMESKLIKEKNEMEKKLLIEQSKEKTKIIEKSNKKLLKSKDEQIDFIQKNNKESIRHAYSEGKMNALTFLTLSYNKTPKMPSLPKESDYVVTEVKSDKEIKYWIKERPEFADEYIAERLLHIYENKEFANYICNIIFKAYRKDDPAEQTFWASDVSRLIYIVRSRINQKDEWVYDKKGGMIKESIIDPLLDEVHDIIAKYYKYMGDRYLHSVIKEESDYYMKKLPVLKVAEKLIKDFKSRQIVKNNIIRVLAPMFFLDRDVDREKDKKKLQNIDKQKHIEYKPPEIEKNTIFDKIKNKKIEESKQIIESSEDTEDFLNDPRVKYKMEMQNKKSTKTIEDFFNNSIEKHKKILLESDSSDDNNKKKSSKITKKSRKN